MIETLIQNALLITGLYFLFTYGNVGYKIVVPLQSLRKKYDWFDYLTKPLYSCMQCMSSVWGITFYIYKIGLPSTIPVFINLLFYLLILLGVMRLIVQFLKDDN